MILCFSTYFVCSLVLVRILSLAENLNFPIRIYFLVMAASLGTMFVGYSLGWGFTAMALPVSIGVALPMVHGAIKGFTKKYDKSSGITKLYGGLLIVNALHFLDYPFLRPDPQFAVFGFSLALVLLVSFSIFLPAFIIKRLSDRYSETLEEEVKKRTESLTESNTRLVEVNYQLDKKNFELEVLTEENRSLLNIVCHDIMTPTEVTQLALEELKASPWQEQPQFKLNLDRIDLSTNTIKEILFHVRNLQAIKEGKGKIDLTPVDLRQAIIEIYKIHEAQLKLKNLRLTCDYKVDDGSKVLAEPKTLKNHVLNNLISNAIKFSYPGDEIKLKVEKNGQYILFEIKDHGVGMGPEVAENLFNMARPPTRRGTKGENGTGFGMPIVKSCLRQYGAEISVTSQSESLGLKNHGSTFKIYFRRVA